MAGKLTHVHIGGPIPRMTRIIAARCDSAGMRPDIAASLWRVEPPQGGAKRRAIKSSSA